MLNRGLAAVPYFSSLARFASFTILYKKADARCLAYEIMLNGIESVESGRRSVYEGLRLPVPRFHPSRRRKSIEN